MISKKQKAVFGSLAFTLLVLLSSGFWWPGKLSLEPTKDDRIPFISQQDLELSRLEQWVGSQEEALDLKGPLVRSQIQWASGKQFQKSDLVLVFLHGMSASPDEMSPTLQILAEKLEANLYLQRLDGHGFKNGQKLGEATAESWLKDAYFAFLLAQKLGDKVVVVGNSTGASLAMILTAQKLIAPKALVLMSPNFRPRDWYSWLLHGPLGETFAKLVFGSEYAWSNPDPKMQEAWTTRFPSKVLVEMMRLLRVLESENLKNISEPTLVLFSEKDSIVSTDLIRSRFEDIGAEKKELTAAPTDKHVIAGKYTSAETVDWTVEKIFQFLEALK